MRGGRLNLDTEDFFEVLTRQRRRTVRGVRDAGGHAFRHLRDEFKVIGSAKHKEQFRACVKARPDPIKRRRDVLAHPDPIRA